MKRSKKDSDAYETGYMDGFHAANTRIRDVIFDDRLRGNELAGVYYALEYDLYGSEFVVSDTARALQMAAESREYRALLRFVLASANKGTIQSASAVQQ